MAIMAGYPAQLKLALNCLLLLRSAKLNRKVAAKTGAQGIEQSGRLRT
jgi:hypothetical protein